MACSGQCQGVQGPAVQHRNYVHRCWGIAARALYTRPLAHPTRAQTRGPLGSARLSGVANTEPSATTRGAPIPAAATSAATIAAKASPRSSSRPDLNAALVAAVAEQFRRESLPWIQDLVEPLLAGPPPPLAGTVPPEQLADPDSRFLSVHGVRLHYKIRERVGERRREEEVAAQGRGADVAAAAAEAAPMQVRRTADSATGQADCQGGGGVAVGSAGAAPTLMLLHGLNGSTFSWRLLMDGLAASVGPGAGGCRVVAFDRPPYGLSQRPLLGRPADERDSPYSLAGAARLTAGLLDALAVGASSSSTSSSASAASPSSISALSSPISATASSSSSSQRARTPGRAVLVGHSAGAAVAVETALRYPDRVAGLVLVAPAVATDERGFLARADLGQLLRFAWTRALLAAEGPGLQYVRRQVLRRKDEVEGGRLGIYSDEREVPREVIEGYLRPLRAHDWDAGTLRAYRSFQVNGSPPPLHRLRVPVLLLAGRQDRTVPLESVQRLGEALRRDREAGCVTETVVLERCGHAPMDERPEETLQAIVDFVNRHCC